MTRDELLAQMAEQARHPDYLSTPSPSLARLALVAHCLYRGGSLPVSLQPECGCSELYRCHAGYGPARCPHAATTRDCLACVAERIVPDV